MTDTRAHTHTHTMTHAHNHTHTHTHCDTHARAHARTHARTHGHTRTDTHTRARTILLTTSDVNQHFPVITDCAWLSRQTATISVQLPVLCFRLPSCRLHYTRCCVVFAAGPKGWHCCCGRPLRNSLPVSRPGKHPASQETWETIGSVSLPADSTAALAIHNHCAVSGFIHT